MNVMIKNEIRQFDWYNLIKISFHEIGQTFSPMSFEETFLVHMLKHEHTHIYREKRMKIERQIIG